MDFFEWAIRTAENIHRHGLNLQIVILSIFTLYNVRLIRKMVYRRLPKRFRHEDRLERVEHKLDALMSAGGVTWDADLRNGKIERRKTDGQQRKSLLQRAVYALVTTAKYFTPLKGTYHSQQRRMNMKSKFLSRKFLMAVISAGLVIANDGLNLGLDSNTIIAFGSIVVGWIIGEAAVDVSKKDSSGSDKFISG